MKKHIIISIICLFSLQCERGWLREILNSTIEDILVEPEDCADVWGGTFVEDCNGRTGNGFAKAQGNVSAKWTPIIWQLAGVQNPIKELKIAISNGSALNKFREMVAAHGGSLKSLDNPNTHKPEYCEKIYAETDGYITSMDTLNLGMAVVYLGGGRLQKGDKLDPSVGIVFHKKRGDKLPLWSLNCHLHGACLPSIDKIYYQLQPFLLVLDMV